MHKFTRRQVSSELNYPKMYNIYIYIASGHQQAAGKSKNVFFFICLFFNIVIM